MSTNPPTRPGNVASIISEARDYAEQASEIRASEGLSIDRLQVDASVAERPLFTAAPAATASAHPDRFWHGIAAAQPLAASHQDAPAGALGQPDSSAGQHWQIAPLARDSMPPRRAPPGQRTAPGGADITYFGAPDTSHIDPSLLPDVRHEHRLRSGRDRAGTMRGSDPRRAPGQAASAADAGRVPGRPPDTPHWDASNHPRVTHPALWERISGLSVDELVELYEQQQAELVKLSQELEEATRRNVELSMGNLQRLQCLQCSNEPIIADITMQPPALSDVATKVRTQARLASSSTRSDLSQSMQLKAGLKRGLNGGGGGGSGGVTPLAPRKLRKSGSVKDDDAQQFDPSLPAMFSQEEAANILLQMQNQLTSDSTHL